MNTYIDNRLITLNSKNATKRNGTYNSDVIFNFNGILKEEKDIINATVELINAQIPVSFYAINQTNNKLSYTLGTTKSITISVGNYSSTQLLSEIRSKFSANGDTGFSLTISLATGNIKFTNATDFTFNYASSTLMSILGFTASASSTSGVLTSPYPLNLGTITSLNIISDSLASYNYSSNSNLVNSIMTLSVDKAPWGIIAYTSQNQTRLLRNTIINSIDIKIQDQNGNFIDFNNINWNLTFSINILRLIPVISKLDFMEVLNNEQNRLNNLGNTTKQNEPPKNEDDELQILGD